MPLMPVLLQRSFAVTSGAGRLLVLSAGEARVARWGLTWVSKAASWLQRIKFCTTGPGCGLATQRTRMPVLPHCRCADNCDQCFMLMLAVKKEAESLHSPMSALAQPLDANRFTVNSKFQGLMPSPVPTFHTKMLLELTRFHHGMKRPDDMHSNP